MPTIAEQNEAIRRAREARYFELWPTTWDALEYESAKGAGSLKRMKDTIRIELPYIEDSALAEAKAAKIKEVEDLLKGKEENSTFVFGAHTFNLHSKAVLKASGVQALLTAGMPMPDPVMWTDAVGNDVEIAHANFPAFGATMGAKQLALETIAKTKAAEIAVLSTVEAVTAYDAKAGW